MSKRPLLPPELLAGLTKELTAALSDDNDTAVVLVGAGYVDACIGSLLSEVLIDSSVSSKLLSAGTGLLGSFSARADLCYALGMISKLFYMDLCTMAEVRNTFAHHHLALSFVDPKVALLCSRLSFATSPESGFTLAPCYHRAFEHPKQRFVMSAIFLSQLLLRVARGDAPSAGRAIPSLRPLRDRKKLNVMRLQHDQPRKGVE